MLKAVDPQWPRVLRRGSEAALLLGDAGSNTARGGGMDYVICECRVLSQVSATGRSLVQRSHTECGVSECDKMQL